MNIHRMTDQDLRAAALEATRLAVELNLTQPVLADLLFDAGALALEELLARSLGSRDVAQTISHNARRATARSTH